MICSLFVSHRGVELMPALCPTLAAIVNSCRRRLRILVVFLAAFAEKKEKI